MKGSGRMFFFLWSKCVVERNTRFSQPKKTLSLFRDTRPQNTHSLSTMADLVLLLREAGSHVLTGQLPPTPLLTALMSKVRVCGGGRAPSVCPALLFVCRCQ